MQPIVMVRLRVSVMDIGPALGQPFTGAEDQISLVDLLRVPGFLASLQPSDQGLMHRIEQIPYAQNFHQRVDCSLFQEHVWPPL